MDLMKQIVSMFQQSIGQFSTNGGSSFPPFFLPTKKREGKEAERSRVASHSFTGGFAGIGKLPALFSWYSVWYWY